MPNQSPQNRQSIKSALPRRPRRPRRKGRSQDDRPVLEANAAGIDIGARESVVAVPPDRDEHSVRVFGTFTEDLHRLCEWLVACRITTAAMESTGVYGIPLYDLLEARGLMPCVVKARHMNNVPGRRTDWHECQWLQYLHSVGLLRPAFRPTADVCHVRTLLRHRSELIGMAGQHVRHMQKALTQMNLQLHHVMNDITGTTGLAIVDAILAGERNPVELARLRDHRIKASTETIERSLVGTWRAEHLFTLKQSRDLYRMYQQQIVACDRDVEIVVSRFEPRVDPAEKPLPPDGKRRHAHKRRKTDHSASAFELRTEAYKVCGVDVTQIPGLETMVFPLFSEVGRDLSAWPTADHFASWLGLCPDNDITGGRVLWRGVRKGHKRAGQLFRLAAHSLHHNATPLGDYLRRMKTRLGPAAATTATAHKIAIIFYTMIRKQTEYDEGLWAAREAERDRRLEARVKRQAHRLGYQLVPIEQTPAA